MPIDQILDHLQKEANNCARSGADGFCHSKYAIAEYYLCWIFRLHKLFDFVAKAGHSPRKFVKPPFQVITNEWRRQLMAGEAQPPKGDQ